MHAAERVVEGVVRERGRRRRPSGSRMAAFCCGREVGGVGGAQLGHARLASAIRQYWSRDSSKSVSTSLSPASSSRSRSSTTVKGRNEIGYSCVSTQVAVLEDEHDVGDVLVVQAIGYLPGVEAQAPAGRPGSAPGARRGTIRRSACSFSQLRESIATCPPGLAIRLSPVSASTMASRPAAWTSEFPTQSTTSKRSARVRGKIRPQAAPHRDRQLLAAESWRPPAGDHRLAPVGRPDVEAAAGRATAALIAGAAEDASTHGTGRGRVRWSRRRRGGVVDRIPPPVSARRRRTASRSRRRRSRWTTPTASSSSCSTGRQRPGRRPDRSFRLACPRRAARSRGCGPAR